jgi:hypothetical protein
MNFFQLFWKKATKSMKSNGEESTMKKCLFEDFIDDYLFNRLDRTQREAFEEHYFNCSHCFEKMAERDELITVVKAKGSEIFRDVYAPETARHSWVEKVAAFLTPRQWAVAAVSAALILIVAFGIIPNLLKTEAPEFFINDDLIRGSSIKLISPVIDNLAQIPSSFRWQSLGENIEYKLYIYDNGNLIWNTTTKECFVPLSENTKNLLTPGKEYSWQVKAFSAEGALIAVSSRVQFKFASK